MDVAGRSPSPQQGDPNVKTMRMLLRPPEWRALRALAAEQATTVEAIVEQIVRRELARRPRQTF